MKQKTLSLILLTVFLQILLLGCREKYDERQFVTIVFMLFLKIASNKEVDSLFECIITFWVPYLFTCKQSV